MRTVVTSGRSYLVIGQCSALLFEVIFISTFLLTSASAERLPVKTYTVADGLLRDSVYRIKQDSRGFLWFCTTEGISRFDGVSMTSFTVRDGLPHRFTNDFLETKNGTIYIATGKGLARLNPHGLRGNRENPLFTVFIPDNRLAENIRVLYEDKKGQVWAGTSDGLYKAIETGEKIKLENVPLGSPLSSSGGAIAAPSPNTLSIQAITEDRHGSLWIGSYGGGLFRLFPDGKIRRYTADDTAKLGDNKITDLLETNDGRLWLSKRSDQFGGVCLLDTAEIEQPVKECYTTENGLGSNWIRDLLETSDGQIWLATVPGLCRWQGGNAEQTVCKTYTSENDICNDVTTLAEDKGGNLWLGSPCGVKKIARYGFATFSTADGLDSDHVTSVFENSGGELFVTTFPKSERIINRFDGEKFSGVKPRFPGYVDYHGWGWHQTVLQDRRGAWWISSGYGLFRSPDGTNFEDLAEARLEKQETGAKGNEVFRLFEDSRGDIWIATTGIENELKRWERAEGTWHDLTRQFGFSGLRVGSAFGEDKYGNVWIGATSDHGDSALIRYRPGGEIRVLTQKEGSPSGWIQDLFFDSRGRLWIASDNDGVWRLDETDSDRFEFVKYTTATGLTSNSAATVTEDKFGRIYIGTWQGIERLTPETGQIETFTTADGLPVSFVESSYRDRRHNLWFTTGRGLVKFVPEPLRQRQPPNIFITGLRVEGIPQKSVSILGEKEIPRLELASSQRQITVDFIGLGASLGEKLKYEYRFGNSDWTATAERTLNFANLAAGDYRLEIRTQTLDRIYSNSPAVVSFRIAAPFWQQGWFIVLVCISLGLAVYAFYRYRLNKLLEIERTRTRIAADLHDDIGSNLSKISIMSEVARRLEGEKQNELLKSIADISRVSVSSMSDIVWTINPNKDSFLELVRRMRGHAEEILEQKEIFLDFQASESFNELKLDVDLRRNVYLIFKESLNNAVRHSSATKVWVDFEIRKNDLLLTVADNGRGFDASNGFDGNGLTNMKRRAEILNGNFEITSSERQGTRIILTVPLGKWIFKG